MASQKNKDYIKFLTENRAKLGNILEMIEERVEVKNASPVAETAKAEFSYLKKIDPPKFDGDMLNYPDFKRNGVLMLAKQILVPRRSSIA